MLISYYFPGSNPDIGGDGEKTEPENTNVPNVMELELIEANLQDENGNVVASKENKTLENSAAEVVSHQTEEYKPTSRSRSRSPLAIKTPSNKQSKQHVSDCANKKSRCGTAIDSQTTGSALDTTEIQMTDHVPPALGDSIVKRIDEYFAIIEVL